jgi:predicted NACHT family NTPase
MQAAPEGLAGNIISAEDLENTLTAYLKNKDFDRPKERARLIINQLRTRNFILCFLGADTYGFVHRSFLEYFCASEVVERFEKTQKLSLDQLKTEVFGTHWDDESWQEVLCLIAGLIDGRFTGELIEFLMRQDGEAQKFRNLFLAAKCLNEVRERKEIAAVETQLLERLKELTKYDLNYYYPPYGQETNLVKEIRTQAVSAIAFTWKDGAETLPLLKQRAQSDDNGFGRYATVEEIARGWKDDPETLPLLKQWAQSDDNLFVRCAAVIEIARGWKNDPATLPLLKQLAQSDDNSAVRRAAVEEIARRWKEDPETLPLLKQRAQSDDNSAVRQTAVQKIARGWKDDPETLPLLKQCAQSDDNSAVRQTAVQELARGWKDEPEIFEWLGDIALNYPFERLYKSQNNTRKTALEIMLKQYPDRPKTLEILRDRFANDPDEQVRNFAQKQLAKLEKL